MSELRLPPEVVAFLEEVAALRSPPLAINPLTVEQAEVMTRGIRAHLLLGKPLGLVALDDANDSNPYCLVTRGPCAGNVLHLSHDGDAGIAYSSLEAFGAALRAAVREGTEISELPHAPPAPHPNQSALQAELHDVLGRKSNTRAPLVTVYVPLLEPLAIATLELVAASSSFLIRECAARFIAQAPLAEHLALAERLASDPSAQVATPALAAVAVLRARRA